MSKGLSILLIFIFLCVIARSQYTVSGFIKDHQSNETIVGAHVMDTISKKGFVTDQTGWYSIKFNQKAVLKITYVGYQTQYITIKNEVDTLMVIKLYQGEMLNTFEVIDQRLNRANVNSLSTKEILSVPSLTGSPDVIKAMSTLPGIQMQSEGSSLLNVRGGSPGQNLFLIDNAPLIHVNHLGGFLSVFNPDMINHVDIYKGSFPVEYGGKVSSIVNITQKEGSAAAWKGTYCFGITDISASMEGPISNKANIIITGRKTVLFDLFLFASSRFSTGGDYILRYGFYDINTKATWAINSKNKISFNLYQGDDYLTIKSKTDANDLRRNSSKNKWGNYLSSLSLKSVLKSDIYIDNSVSFTHYRLKEDQKELETKNNTTLFHNTFKSTVSHLNFVSNWHYLINNNWQTKFGYNGSYIQHTPYNFSGNSLMFEEGKKTKSNWLNTLFLNNKIGIQTKTDIDLGVRLVSYLLDNYSKYFFEPRMQINFKANENISLNASYMHVYQTSHLLYTQGSISNNEVWIPATENIPAIFSKHTSLGIHFDLFNKNYSFDLSGYYKSMTQLASFKEGIIDIKSDMNWEELVETDGIGYSYGIEFLFNKVFGKTNFQLSYDYSYSIRKFNNINQGLYFAYDYNRPHNLSIQLGRSLNKKWSFNVLWVFQSGMPYTPVIGRQMSISTVPNLDGEIYYFETLIYGERNSARMRDYHRLDIAFQYAKPTKKRKMKSVWTFGVYNLYNRKNPNIYYFNNNATNEIYKPDLNGDFKPLDLYQLSLFPIIPNISYKVYFNVTDFNKLSLKTFKKWLYIED